jgi:methylamine--corrinoid protein Co-methyltransferase
MVAQAIARNTHIIATNDPFVVSGPCTPEILYEVAATAAVGTVSGFQMHGVGGTGGFLENHATGLEMAWQGEIAHAVTKSGWTRDDVNDFCLKMLEKYEHTFDDPNRGKPFEECYDLVSVEPTQEWSDIYHRVRDELFDLGLEFTGKREDWPQRTMPEEAPA